MEYRLTFGERLLILGLLPQQSTFTNMKLIRALREKVLPEEGEAEELEAKAQGERLVWNAAKDVEREYDLTIFQAALVATQLKKLDEEERLEIAHLSLWDKFVGEEPEE